MPTILTQTQAEQFIKKLLEEFFPKGNADEAGTFYHPDVVGDFNGSTIYFADIQNRVRALQANTRDIHFTVEWCVAIDDLIFFTCRQSWINKADNSFSDSLVIGVYRMKNGKIIRIWGKLDAEVDLYQVINQQFAQSMQPFQTKHASKREFLRKLSSKTFAKSHPCLTLTKQEKESLFYYLNGFSAKEAGREMGISPRTFESYIDHIKDALGGRTRVELRKALKL